MKAIKINTTVNTSSGIVLQSGSICLVPDAYLDFKMQNNSIVAVQIACEVYSSLDVYYQGKKPIEGIVDFSTNFSNLLLDISDLIRIESALAELVKSELNEIYPNQVEIVTV
jgi:hypothetical protein